jgi:hypothetical protein
VLVVVRFPPIGMFAQTHQMADVVLFLDLGGLGTLA